MHGCDDTARMAGSGPADGGRTGRGCPEWPHAGGTVGAGRPQHGPGLANPVEPPAAQAEPPREMEADVGGLRPAGGGDRGHLGAARHAVGVAPVGGLARRPHAAVRAEAQPHLAGTPVSTNGVLTLLERQGYRCALSGRILTPETAAFDHIVPVRHGGAHVLENAQVLHKDVNRAKSTLTRAEFIGMCQEVVGWCCRQAARKGEHGSAS